MTREPRPVSALCRRAVTIALTDSLRSPQSKTVRTAGHSLAQSLGPASEVGTKWGDSDRPARAHYTPAPPRRESPCWRRSSQPPLLWAELTARATHLGALIGQQQVRHRDPEETGQQPFHLLNGHGVCRRESRQCSGDSRLSQELPVQARRCSDS